MSPFSERETHFYHGATQNEALARLHYLVEERCRAGLLLGASGTGKSSLLEVFAQEIRDTGSDAVVIDMLAISQRELLWQIATGLGCYVGEQSEVFQLWRLISDRQDALRAEDRCCLLLCDNMEQASAEAQEHLLRIIHSEVTRPAVLTVVLTAREDELHCVNRRLIELSSLRIDLACWNVEETAAFVRQLLERAGQADIFTEAAVEQIHHLSAGLPRRICQLAQLSLLAGVGTEHPQVDHDMVRSVFEELDAVGSLTRMV